MHGCLEENNASQNDSVQGAWTVEGMGQITCVDVPTEANRIEVMSLMVHSIFVVLRQWPPMQHAVGEEGQGTRTNTHESVPKIMVAVSHNRL